MAIVEVPSVVLHSTNRSAAIAAHLEQLIGRGDLPAGSRLPPERELALQLSVSRTSLREAMHELEQKRLVERTPGRGTIVRELPREVLEFAALPHDAATQDFAAELRAVVEPQIAGLAAVRSTSSNIVALHDVLARTHRATTHAQSLDLDVEFHTLLAQATRNPLLTGLHSLMVEWTRNLRTHSHASAVGRRNSLYGHTEILAAVERHDAAAAEQAMRLHLLEVRKLIAADIVKSE